MKNKKDEKQVTAEKETTKDYTQWEERSNAERLKSINTYYKMIIAKSIGEKKSFWNKSMSSKEIDNTIPYNASTGKPYNGIASLVLRAAKEINGYEDSNFITMRQANLKHGTLKFQINEKGEKEYARGVKVTHMVNHEYVNKLDSHGKPLMREVKDKEGNITQEPVKEKVFLKEPKLETITLYHVSQFDNLDQSQLKQRDLESLKQRRELEKDRPRDFRSNLDFLELGKAVTQDLNNFLTSQYKGIDYQKIQHQSLKHIRQNERTQEQGRSL